MIRVETPDDIAAIHRVHVAAFPTDAEARIVDALRASDNLTLSLVALTDTGIVGHIAFSPVEVIRPDAVRIRGVGLAPVAVLPDQQRTGLGGALIRDGLERLRAAGHGFCVVLGHADYYPRFGFVPASRHGVRWELPVPDANFMIRELAPGGLTGVAGVVRYRPEIMTADPLRTPRLRLRPWAATDIDELLTFVADAHVRRYLFDDAIMSREWITDQLHLSEQQFVARGLGLWTARTPAGALVGFAGFMPTPDPAPELVFAVAAEHARMGYGLEMAQAVLEQARLRGHTRITARTDAPNLASQALLRRLGFELADGDTRLLTYVLLG
jgi:putative acetyltransferase